MRSTLLPITIAAVLTVAACGTDDADEPQSTSPDPTENIVGEPVDAELVLLADSADAAITPPTVLTGPTANQAYPGWYSSDPDLYGQVTDALAGLPDYPHASSPLLAFTNGPNCATIDDARLMVDGERVYAVFEGQEQEECLAPHTQVAIFSVDRSQLPNGFKLVGTDDSSAGPTTGPGELLAFEELDATAGFRPPESREISDEASLDAFASSLPSHQDEVRALATELDGERTFFGFVVSGCAATSAELVVTPQSVSAAPVGGEAVRCIAPVFYAAVFAADDENLPDRFMLR